MQEIAVNSVNHSEMINITNEIEALIPGSLKNGVCHIFSKHTTAGLTLNENADDDVKKDFLGFLNKLIPWKDPSFKHFEGNSAAHIKASLMGFSASVPIENGSLSLGTWQNIYFCEFDGPRQRAITVCFVESFEN
jgi:secondary thiamine-phosphate synthase enzyme